MERFINILIIDDDEKNRVGLKEILAGAGNNILLANSHLDALPIVAQKEIGILLINIDSPSFPGLEILKELQQISKNENTYKIVVTDSSKSGSKLVRSLSFGAVDYINLPLNPNLVRAKIEVFKSLFYKDQRIGQLLENIFPENVLEDFNSKGKFSPKRIDNGVVMFTDFVDFSMKSKNMNPLTLLKKLEKYFTVFDEIMERYKLEKIKTIGDAYMALGGVSENSPHPAIRACLAALEIRNYIHNEQLVAKAMNKEFWEIRIGLHMGPLVAGIIGTKKFNFDVWGDSVNIAARAERASIPGEITITDTLAKEIEEYFVLEDRGEIAIHKRGGMINMFFLQKLKNEFSLNNVGKIASTEIRKLCGLSTIDFTNMRTDIVSRLKALLPEELIYHDVDHTFNVEKAAIRYATLEGIHEDDMYLLRTAALYHDSGFILQYHKNEEFAIQLAQNNLPVFGYSDEEIRIICNIIAATQSNTEPKTILEKIMCDADHDYLGRPDYNYIANRLRAELQMNDHEMSDLEWIEFQLNYLENVHKYFTDTAKNIRELGKTARINELKNQLKQLANITL